MTEAPHWLMRLLLVDSWWGVWLALFGLLAQGIFMARMLVQWLASERARASVVPVSFWWLSLWGSVLLLVYGALRQDVVIIAAQLFGFIVYGRNLWFIRGTRRLEQAPPEQRRPRG
ncbi:lipid-A-disaccharide synthase N-terminal domain-containing protein [Oceanicella sp. SM1341]|uniref:lipid-A-disaccharide synthase N-terminal domain-containing protein n=1 Tax=Oceanicella sp. SM1341 TaxID=1548889 RepID=UPI000E4F8F0F|nr:lipid-A-disaccharide synthase N-terminal domain-containing protein [Oceanicella sp. SM1341]